MDQCLSSRAEFAIKQRYIQSDQCMYGSKCVQYGDNYKGNSKTLLRVNVLNGETYRSNSQKINSAHILRLGRP